MQVCGAQKVPVSRGADEKLTVIVTCPGATPVIKPPFVIVAIAVLLLQELYEG